MLRYKEKRWDSKRMLDSGGMPSSHSATVTALAVAIALQDGTSGSAFAVAVVLACVVCTIEKQAFALLLIELNSAANIKKKKKKIVFCQFLFVKFFAFLVG